MDALATVLDRLTIQGELCENLPDQAVRCLACAHRCRIAPGKRGICQVRFNQNGVLRVPSGYVAALQADPIEKKPFAHVLPGATALTFGMLGCDFHCGYCFLPETPIITNNQVVSLQKAFEMSHLIYPDTEGEIAFPDDLWTISATGHTRKISKIFRHFYRGKTVTIKPMYFPPFTCTPEHQIYATTEPGTATAPVSAESLTKQNFLLVPRHYQNAQEPVMLSTQEILAVVDVYFSTPHYKNEALAHFVMAETAAGKTSRQIAESVGKDPSYIRHVRSKIRREDWSNAKKVKILCQDGYIKFSNEKGTGIPGQILLNQDMAYLLGLYCAEGSVQESKKRPNSLKLLFSFGLNEIALAEQTKKLLLDTLGVSANIVQLQTTFAVIAGNTSAAWLFKLLCGTGALEKRVPTALYNSPTNVVTSFLDAYVECDGHIYQNGKVSLTTKSQALADGVGWLCLKNGILPSIYHHEVPYEREIEGRPVKQSPWQHTIVWYKPVSSVDRNLRMDDNYYYVPIRSVETSDYTGDVYNLEVEDEHNYLAGFFAVKNCQNWLTSQALRDPASGVAVNLVRQITPQEVVQAARRAHAEVLVSSYNEPLITSEWAVAIFKEARAAGLLCAYVSNGNATPQALEYLKPYLAAYKVDLKSMQAKNYRSLGGVLKHVLDTIQKAHDIGLWVEVVTLIVPGFNDSNEELFETARFLRSVSMEIPWHVTAFHKDYKMTTPENTPSKTLLRAAEIGREAGLNHVYAGNLPGRVEEYEDTHCPHCNRTLIRRHGYVIGEYRLTGQGTCPSCGTKVAGVWPENPKTVKINGAGTPRSVY